MARDKETSTDYDYDEVYTVEDSEEEEKSKKWGFWGKKRKKRLENDDFLIDHELKAKSLSDFRQGYDSNIEISADESTFTDLFDKDAPLIDEETSKNFELIQKERRKRVEQAAQIAGVSLGDVASELGIIAPPPVSSVATDVTDGQTVVKSKSDSFQNAIIKSAETQTIELKLNFENETLELIENKTEEDDLVSNESIEQNEPEIDSISTEISQENLDFAEDNLDDEDSLEKVLQEVAMEVESFESTQPLELTTSDSVDSDIHDNLVQEDTTAIDETQVFDNMNDFENPEKSEVSDSELGDTLSSIADIIDKDNTATEADEPKTSDAENELPTDEKAVLETSDENYQDASQPDDEEAENDNEFDVLQRDFEKEYGVVEEAQEDEEPDDGFDKDFSEKIKKRREEKQKKSEPDTFPVISNYRDYRDKTVPIHLVHVDNLYSSILAESNGIKKDSKEVTAPSRKLVSGLYDDSAQTNEQMTDYKNPSQAKKVSQQLKKDMQALILKLFVTALLSTFLFFITTVNEQTFLQGNETGDATAYLVSSLIAVLVSVIVCIRTVVNGVISLFKARPTVDSAMSIASVTVVIHIVASFFNQEAIVNGTEHIYSLIVVVAMFLNNLGKMISLRRIHSNFRFITSREQKYAVQFYGEYGNSLKFAENCVAETPIIAYQKKADFLKRFLQLSNEPDPSQVSSQNLTTVFLLASFALCAIRIIQTQNIFMGLSIFTAGCCATIALGSLICVNLPLSRFCKKARRFGAMVSSYYAVAEVAKANAVMVDANDLFPSGTVSLEGVKTFGRQNKDIAILYGAALSSKVGGTFDDIFSQILTEDEKTLHFPSDVVIDGEHGISGVVQNSRVLIGSRDLLIKNNIEAPKKEDVIEYISKGNKIFFLAMNGELTAMLIVKYKTDKRKRIELQKLEANGISVIVRSTDTNITKKMICNTFSLSQSSVNVVTGELGEIYAKAVRDPIPRADALVATKGKPESMMNVISDCNSQKKMISLIVAMQCVGMILGFFLVVTLGFFGGTNQLTATSIFLYLFFWFLVIFFVPKFRKM